MKTDYTDVYIIACCDKLTEYNQVMESGLFDYARALRKDGEARFLGISTYDNGVVISFNIGYTI